MSERFEVGEIAILEIPFGDSCFGIQVIPNGTEVEISGPPQTYKEYAIFSPFIEQFSRLGLGHPISVCGDSRWAAISWLRKRKPPDDQKKRETDKPELGSWDVCPFGTDQKPLWRPRKVPA
jgi:hypothetical protein